MTIEEIIDKLEYDLETMEELLDDAIDCGNVSQAFGYSYGYLRLSVLNAIRELKCHVKEGR